MTERQEGAGGQLHVTPPGELADEIALEALPCEPDLEVAHTRDLYGLGQGRVGLHQGWYLEVGIPLLGLVEVFCSADEVLLAYIYISRSCLPGCAVSYAKRGPGGILGPQVHDCPDPVLILERVSVHERDIVVSGREVQEALLHEPVRPGSVFTA